MQIPSKIVLKTFFAIIVLCSCITSNVESQTWKKVIIVLNTSQYTDGNDM